MSNEFKDNWFASAYNFGHHVHIIKGDYTVNEDGSKVYRNWRYSDGTLTKDVDTKTLVCPECGKTETEDGHDPCIANLPGVKFACCGHGKEGPYVTYEDGTSYYDEDAIREIKKLKEEMA